MRIHDTSSRLHAIGYIVPEHYASVPYSGALAVSYIAVRVVLINAHGGKGGGGGGGGGGG